MTNTESEQRKAYRESCKYNLNDVCALMSGKSKNGLFHITRNCCKDNKCDRLNKFDKNND